MSDRENGFDPEIRSKGIGGSESAAIMGLSPFAGPMDIYLQKLGLVEEQELTPDLEWGSRLEQAVADKFLESAAESGIITEDMELVRGSSQQHPDAPFLVGTPDYIIKKKDPFPNKGGKFIEPILGKQLSGVEIKTTRGYFSDQWGPEDSDEIPPHVIIQCQHYMMLTGLDTWHVAVLIGARDYRQYCLKANQKLQDSIIQAISDFWINHVLKKEPPEVDGSEAWREYLNKTFPKDESPVREATDDEIALMLNLRDVLLSIKRYEDTAETIRNRLKKSIGDAGGLNDDDVGKIYWKKQKPRKRIDYLKALDLLKERHKIPQKEIDFAIEAATSFGEIARVFRPYLK